MNRSLGLMEVELEEEEEVADEDEVGLEEEEEEEEDFVLEEAKVLQLLDFLLCLEEEEVGEIWVHLLPEEEG